MHGFELHKNNGLIKLVSWNFFTAYFRLADVTKCEIYVFFPRCQMLNVSVCDIIVPAAIC